MERRPPGSRQGVLVDVDVVSDGFDELDVSEVDVDELESPFDDDDVEAEDADVELDLPRLSVL
jgi:hypothetical protein